MCIDIKLLTILPRAESYPPPPPPPRNVPKCAIIVVFDFSWGDCIKRRKKLETMVIKNWVGGGGGGRGVNKVDNYMVSLKMVNKV